MAGREEKAVSGKSNTPLPITHGVGGEDAVLNFGSFDIVPNSYLFAKCRTLTESLLMLQGRRRWRYVIQLRDRYPTPKLGSHSVPKVKRKVSGTIRGQ
jgi:hypothetical protein